MRMLWGGLMMGFGKYLVNMYCVLKYISVFQVFLIFFGRSKICGTTIKEGLHQTKAYMDKCSAAEGHLLIFDRRTHRKWAEKIWDEAIEGVLIFNV